MHSEEVELRRFFPLSGAFGGLESFAPATPATRLLMPNSQNRARLRSMFARLCASYAFADPGLAVAALDFTACASASESLLLEPLLVLAHSSLYLYDMLDVNNMGN